MSLTPRFHYDSSPYTPSNINNYPEIYPSPSENVCFNEENFDEYHQDDEVRIPKIIMQTWKDRNIPDNWKESPVSISNHMPGWEYVLMTDEDNREFVSKHFPDFLPFYDAFPYAIQRADAIRACWLYVKGGIYMDLDFIVQKPLDPLFRSDNELYVVPSGNVPTTITNSFMASKPGCKIWLTYIEEMKKNLPYWAYGKHLKVMTSTGPLCFSRSIQKWSGVYATLPSKLIMPCSVCTPVCNTDKAYLIPLIGKSWCGYDSHAMNFGLCNWRALVIAIVIIVLAILIYIILRRYRYY